MAVGAARFGREILLLVVFALGFWWMFASHTSGAFTGCAHIPSACSRQKQRSYLHMKCKATHAPRRWDLAPAGPPQAHPVADSFSLAPAAPLLQAPDIGARRRRQRRWRLDAREGR